MLIKIGFLKNKTNKKSEFCKTLSLKNWHKVFSKNLANIKIKIIKFLI